MGGSASEPTDVRRGVCTSTGTERGKAIDTPHKTLNNKAAAKRTAQLGGEASRAKNITPSNVNEGMGKAGRERQADRTEQACACEYGQRRSDRSSVCQSEFFYTQVGMMRVIITPSTALIFPVRSAGTFPETSMML